MACTVFYSWQSDLPSATNREFIARALDKAVQAIYTDTSIEVEPVIDRDTLDVPGAPDITSTIFEKIDEASVFVCDVSLVNQAANEQLERISEETGTRLRALKESGGEREAQEIERLEGLLRACEQRLVPNPNVLIELGYAINALGLDRIILVVNTAFGRAEDLPFNIRQKRALRYSASRGEQDRSPQKKALEKVLVEALRTIFERLGPRGEEQPTTLAERAVSAISQDLPQAPQLLRDFMASLSQAIRELSPRGTSNDASVVQAFEKALESSVPLVAEFTQVVSCVASSSNSRLAEIVYRGFEAIAREYAWTPDFGSNRYSPWHFDLPKFLGHELFVSLIAVLLREERWQLIGNLLAQALYVSNATDTSGSAVPFTYLSKRVVVLEEATYRQMLPLPSFHTQFLTERHETPDNGLVPLGELQDADYFLFLRSISQDPPLDSDDVWPPWSASLGITAVPRFLVTAVQRQEAVRLAAALGIPDVDTLRDRMARAKADPRMMGLIRLSERLSQLDTSTLGQR